MKAFRISLIYFLLIFIISCNEDPAFGGDSDNFKFQVNVTGNNLSSLEPIKVSVWNKVLYNSSLRKNSSSNHVEATASISFQIPIASIVELSMYDVENNKIETMIDNQDLQVGNYSNHFHRPNNIGTAVFKIKLIARSESDINNILFQDSTYAVLVAPDPVIAQIGITDETGSFSTSNKMLFPSLYNLDSFIRTSEVGPDPIGTFELPNEIIIALTSSTSEIKYFKKSISEGENIFNLTWEEGSDTYPEFMIRPENQNQVDRTISNCSEQTDIPTEFKLGLVYPNPFN
jgi:hypothetical protein